MSKNSILTKPQHFHEFFTQFFFFQFFSWNQSCQQLKSPKLQHFHEFFTPKIYYFYGKSKLIFLTKNEDLEQCAQWNKNLILKNLKLFNFCCKNLISYFFFAHKSKITFYYQNRFFEENLVFWISVFFLSKLGCEWCDKNRQ